MNRAYEVLKDPAERKHPFRRKRRQVLGEGGMVRCAIYTQQKAPLTVDRAPCHPAFRAPLLETHGSRCSASKGLAFAQRLLPSNKFRSYLHAYPCIRCGEIWQGMTWYDNDYTTFTSVVSQCFELVQLEFGLLHTWGARRPSLIFEHSNVPGSLRNSKDDPLGGATYAKTPTQLPQPREM